MKTTKLFGAAALAAMLAAPTLTQASDPGVETGRLICELVDVTNVIVYKNEKFACTFTGISGKTESYAGEIDKIGIDLTIKEGETLLWIVFAPTTDLAPGALSGTYVGGSANVALGAGVGAKVLVGGLENSIALQPLSVQGSIGLGAALGIESFELTAN